MNYPPSIPVLGGSPDGEEPASFVRFVLPFGFRADGGTAGRSVPAFVADEPPEERRGYLTEETDKVLFDRAGWFKLDPWEPRRFPVPRIAAGGAFAVEIRQPRLVLFEWDPGDREGREDTLATGFLVIEASFPEGGDQTPSLDDLLRFQELFRYWEEPFTGHDEEKGFSAVLGAWPANPGEDAYSGRWKPLLEPPVIVGGGRWSLSPSFPYGDPRTFVWTCAVVDGGARALTERFGAGVARHAGHWIKLLNVDLPGPTPSATAESTEFEREWADAHTYRRWEEHGSLYGFAYHGGAMLAPPLRRPPLWKNWAGHYFDQTLLLLYLRVTSFRFSRRLTEVTEMARGRGADRARWRREFGRLRHDFALFTNLYQFPLVSNQQQGIEMYGLARRHLDVEELFREVEKEITSTHEYFENEANQLQTQVMTVLTGLAAVGLPLALVTGFFGMNVVAEDVGAYRGGWPALLLAVVVGFAAFFALAAGLWWKRDRLMDRLARWGLAGPGRRRR